MKHWRKLLVAVAAVVMAMAMAVPAFAADDGSITVTNATKGQTYNAYLVFPASPSNPDDLGDGVTYTATAAQVAVSGFDNYFDKIVNASGTYTITKKSTAADNDVITWVKNNIDSLKQGDAIPGTVATDDTVTFSNLAYGYYYITSSLGSLVTIDTAGKNVEVVDKNESTPTGPDKIIEAQDSSIDEALDDVSSDTGKTNDSSVGSIESFEVTFNATNWVQAKDAQTAGTGDPNDKKKALVWKFKDTPTGLSIDASTVKVFVNGTTEITNTITDVAVDATTGVLTFTIPWVDENENFLYQTQTEGSALIPVTVTYDATVLASAATAPAPNTVEVTYDRDDTQDVELGDSTTTTYTYKFKVKKVDENNAALDGAEFQLFFGESEDPLTFTMNEGKYQYDPTGTITNIAPVKGTGTDAIAEIIGLDNATYTLKEVVVPNGYTKAADETVSNLTKEDTGEEAAVTTITVENEKGTVLPSTGGMGTTILYVIGGIMVLLAVVFLITKKRVAATRKDSSDDIL